jgi:hypothetical protein
MSGKRQMTIRLDVQDHLSWRNYAMPKAQTSNLWISYLILSLLEFKAANLNWQEKCLFF